MTYLGFPRLNFAGTFQADVSTGNNVPAYFDNSLYEPRFQWRMNVPDMNGLWNPRGSGAIRLTDLTVTSGFLPDGTALTDADADPAVGGRIADDDRRPSGKFVDLDPENQDVSEIYGMRLRLLDARGRVLLRGEFEAAALEDMWDRAIVPRGMNDASATYQSVLGNLEWAEPLDSPLLCELRERAEGGLLSMKFSLDGVAVGITSWPDNVTFGRMVGSIGPCAAGEPKRLVAGRRLRPTGPDSEFQSAPCRVDEAAGTVFVDLGNSTRAQTPGGELIPLGPLRLAVLDEDGAPRELAPMPDVDTGFYHRTAGIAAVGLSPEQLDGIRERRLAVVDVSGGTPVVLLAENEDATFLRAEESVFRIYPEPPDNTAQVVVHATRYGRPAAGLEIALEASPMPMALELPKSVVTGPDGRAVITMVAHDPGNPRRTIDGVQLRAGYGPSNGEGPQTPEGREGLLNVLVFNHHPVPERPTWVNDVQPVLQQYANLYPAMRDVLDLGHPGQVLRSAVYMRKTLLAPVSSPNHMPVTRDLSPGKRDTIVKWLGYGPDAPILEIRTVEELRAALQQALLVEHATIPPYLSALLSIKSGYNAEISGTIRGVVLEEMQHMCQAGNLLNAVGGRPRIGRPGLVPTYPGRLPGPVLPDLTVRLRKMSLEYVRNVFMPIEAPEYPVVDGTVFKGAVIAPDAVDADRHGRILAVDPAAVDRLERWFTEVRYPPMTIGGLYGQIARAIIELDRDGRLFSGDPDRQVSWPEAPQVLYRVTDKRTALLAIHQIINQGDGSPQDLDGVGDAEDFGHYYRFQEIVEGRRLARDADGRWGFTGAPVPFDPEGVYPVTDDPDSYRLPHDSAARRDSLLCDEFYTRALGSLDRVFNGHPEEMDDAVGLMYQFQVHARKLYAVPCPDDPGSVLGPGFQSPGVRL